MPAHHSPEAYAYRSDNLKNLYGIENVPGDTALREGLDGVEPAQLQRQFAPLIEVLHKEGILKSREMLGGYVLIAVDGTQHFCSGQKDCPHCMVKTHRGEGNLYYHQLLAGVQVHPEQKTVFPIASEAIVRQDGAEKNDCEINAAKRLLPLIGQMLPEEKLLLTFDALYANGPLIKLLHEYSMNYIIVIKEGDVCIQVEQIRQRGELKEYSWRKDKSAHTVRFANDLVLNGKYRDIKVNYMEYEETEPAKGKMLYRNSWITDIIITEGNAAEVAASGRARWKMENETFNTLKNQGYHLEHNYGHGKKNLTTNFALLTMLAFFVDQIAQHQDDAFQKAMKCFKTKRAFWQRVREINNLLPVKSMNAIYRYISGEISYDFPRLE